jgi:alpha-tubulin suppressor-like RCC1 family protein
VAYPARCARQRRCNEVPPIAAGFEHSLFVGASGRLLSCGRDAAVGHVQFHVISTAPELVLHIDRVRSVAAGLEHSLVLGCDGWVFSCGFNAKEQLGHGHTFPTASPEPVWRIARGVAAAGARSFAVSQSGAVFSWGESFWPDTQDVLRPTIVEGFGGVRVRCMSAEFYVAFAIGEDGELFSWGRSVYILGHGDEQDQPSPKRFQARCGVCG